MILKKLYKLPWSKSDNPNGWIEPTSVCNMQCPGCYRGCDQSQHIGRHLPLNEVIEQIDFLIKNRNIHTLSIAGGEPLMYPQLDEIIKYAVKKDLRIMIYTNGLMLNKERLEHYKKLGVHQFLIHIDEYQNRGSITNQEQAIIEREKYCRLFDEVPGVLLGFIQPLTPLSIKSIKPLTDFFIQNRSRINLVVFTLYREIAWQHENKPHIDTSLEINSALEQLSKVGLIKPASYLAATKNKTEPAWVFSYSIGSNNNILSYLNAKATKLIHSRYRQKKGRYLFISRTGNVSKKGLLNLVFFPGMLGGVIKSLWYRGTLHLQTCLVIRGPIANGKSWDLCEGCPDAMLHNGKLLPSCILEDLKNKSTTQEFFIDKNALKS